MRVVIAPDGFGGTMSAAEAADAIADGWRAVAPSDDVEVVPMSDGGPGFLDVLAASLTGRRIDCRVTGPIGAEVEASVLVVDDTGYVESAQACGLHLVPPDARDPGVATTYGVGQLLAAIHGVRRIVVGLGGSATNDGGAGLWAALGAEPATILRAGGLGLAGLSEVLPPRPVEVPLVAATDVDNPLLGPNGASAVFGPQKGAHRAQVLDLDDALREWAGLVENLTGRPGLRDEPGAGAAGGLGFGLFALGASRASGLGLVVDAVGLRDRVATADLVVTGEGAFDSQSLRGKVVAGVAAVAQQAGVPCVVVAGQVAVGRRDAAAAGIDEAFAVTDAAGSVEAALAAGVDGVRETAMRAARSWSRGG